MADSAFDSGGDIAHHGGEFRPTKYLPLPDEITPNPLVPPYTSKAPVCPGAIFEALHPKKSTTEPFYTPVLEGIHHNGAQAKETIDQLAEFDAHYDIFVNVAHDDSLYDVVEFYPKTANGWTEKGWKKEGMWRFLRDFDTGDAQYKPQ
jgi:hypothetical protein